MEVKKQERRRKDEANRERSTIAHVYFPCMSFQNAITEASTDQRKQIKDSLNQRKGLRKQKLMYQINSILITCAYHSHYLIRVVKRLNKEINKKKTKKKEKEKEIG